MYSCVTFFSGVLISVLSLLCKLSSDIGIAVHLLSDTLRPSPKESGGHSSVGLDGTIEICFRQQVHYQAMVIMFGQRFAAWFAVQVVPRFETSIARALEYKGYEAFLPRQVVRHPRFEQTTTCERPLFPGYIFCRMQGTALGLIVSTPRVVRIVSFGGRPSPVSEDEIDGLRKLADLGVEARPHPFLNVGQRVQINCGPLAGMSGILIQIRNQRRLVISVETIMKSVSVDVGASDVCAFEEGLALAS